MKLVLFFLGFSLWGLSGNAATYGYNYNSRCADAYKYYLSMQLPEANALIREELKENPYNLFATYLADYEDCILLLFNGNKIDYEQRDGHLKQRIAILDRGSRKSPWHRLCKAGIYLRWAVIYIRFGENFKAASAFRKSFLLLKENQRLFPRFAYNNVFYGLEEAVAGTIPGEYQWVASLLGIKGDVKSGIGKLNQFLELHSEQDLFYREAFIYACYLRFYLLSQQDEVWRTMSKTDPGPDNLMLLFVKANLAVNSRRAAVGIETLKQAMRVKGHRTFPVIDYEMGRAMLLRLQPAGVDYLQQFLDRYKGGFFVKDALMRISLSYYIRKNMPLAEKYRREILNKGSDIADADKQALRFAQSKDWPHPVLLKARLLTDAGDYNRALDLIGDFKASDFEPADRVEYLFRRGRLADELKDTALAISFYKSTIEAGRDRPEHFAARSALQLGFLHENYGRKREAAYWFRESMSMANRDFKNSIDQQAKAGMDRLGN